MIYPLIHFNNEIYMVEIFNLLKKGDSYLSAPPNRQLFRSCKKDGYTGWKILASTNKSLGLPLLPDVEEADESIFSKAKQDIDKSTLTVEMDKLIALDAWYKGYKAASKKKWSDEDMGKLWQYVVDGAKNLMLGVPTTIGTFEEYLQSLQPKPIAVEVEMERRNILVEEGNAWETITDIETKNYIVTVKRWIYDE